VDVPAGLPVDVTGLERRCHDRQGSPVRLTDSSGDIVVRDVPGDIEINDSSATSSFAARATSSFLRTAR